MLWGVSDKVPYESVLSGKGEAFTVMEDGTYILYQSSTDAREDGTGRTVKPCYFYYENGSFHEYGAMAVGQDSFLGLPGAALATGIMLSPLFRGTGYAPEQRTQGDFGSDVYLIEESDGE